MGSCSIDGCTRNRKYAETGWCQTHYHRNWRTGSLDVLPKPMRDDLSYRGAHERVRSLFGTASYYLCVKCGAEASEWAYDGTDQSERDERMLDKYPVKYSVWPEFYMPLCFPCHRAMDGGARAQRRTECKHGHRMTDENTYTRPSRPGTRECKTCRYLESRSRYLRRKSKVVAPIEPGLALDIPPKEGT